MRDSTLPATAPAPSVAHSAFLTRLLRQLVLHRVRGLRYGSLTIIDGGESLTFGEPGSNCSLSATLNVHDVRFYRELVFGGSVGAGAAYSKGFWSCDDLTMLVRILVRNRKVLDGLEAGFVRLTFPLRKVFHALRRGTRRGSRRNIAAHYDLGNDFFALFLDETMTYSCGIFERADSTLREASLAKIDRICQKLQLSPSDHLLEIGTGWGSFALHAAQRYGCHVTTTTISLQQYQHARQRIAEAGLTGRVTVLLKDYRELTGQYDKLVSIEMIEAVGHAFYNTYFTCCNTLLKPDGMMLLQAITIADHQYETAKREVDFIQRYIFPGSSIPSITAICQALARVTDMRVFHLEDLTPHYAETVRHWRERFFANLNQVRRLGCSEELIRMWEFYFCYCEGGFRERVISDVQMLFTKPLCRRSSILPPLSLS